MEHISDLINSGNPYPVRSGRMKQNDSQENMNSEKLLKMPPTVRPERKPDEIIFSVLPDPEERRALAGFLIQYRKTEAQWDDFRKKVPDDLVRALAEITA